ncbi:iron uptake porin [[Phormidium] sp. ETS-05]|uniref:iron uptake porin n=1 Tax=[Phormidium] sp. ETS-05 TaxID=222819 RepID=UPI0018EF1E62|nr:iron uptake porin [[Phormidium] sp. ETS-05]
MIRLFWQGLKYSPTAVAAVFLASTTGAIAQEVSSSAVPPAPATTGGELLQQLEEYNPVNLSLQQGDALQQVNSVSNLRDVRPTDWAYSALQSLAERYGCLTAYPDGTYRGNRALTRYEFAAGLDACLNSIQRLIQESASQIGGADLSSIRRLQEEFAAELATLRARVDGLEVRTAELEANQFSTTAKLNGEILFALTDSFGDGILGTDNSEVTFAQRTRLNFDASLTGEDRLRVQLESANMPGLRGDITGTNMTRLAFDSNTDNEFEISELYYRFPLGEKAQVEIDPTGAEAYDMLFDPYSPLQSTGSGALSRFGRFNPILRQGSGGPGINLDYKISDQLGVTFGYLAPNGESPTSKNGLFNGANAAYAQLNIEPTDNIGVGLTYIRSYFPGGNVNLTGSTGSRLASNPFGGVATSANTFGGQASMRVTPNINLSGWFGFIDASAEDSSGGVSEGDNATVINWAVTLSFPDVGKKGSLGAILVGTPPKVTSNDTGAEDLDTALHIEGLYRYPLTSKIAITPGFYIITNPEHNENNDAVWVGTLRTTFKF